MENREKRLSTAVLYVFAAAAILLMLLASARLSAAKDQTEKTAARVQQLDKENRVLSARLSGLLSYEELEGFAVEKLGMGHLSPEQIEIIEWKETQ